MVDKYCKECGNACSSNKFCKGMCPKCYERIRTNSKSLQQLICKCCGPVLTKKLIDGVCPKCYHKAYKISNRKISKCPSCFKNKLLLNDEACRSCQTNAWRKMNPGKHVAYVANRRASKKLATPKWVDLKAIENIYSNCPPDFEVDHIIPLTNENICGLHVPSNLQYLSKTENIKKNNQFDGTLDNLSWRLYVGG